jgi:TonB family protein
MSVHARSYGISFGIHAVAFGIILLLGALSAAPRAIVLDFSIAGSAKTGPQTAAHSFVPKAVEQKIVTPVEQNEQAVPVRKENIEETPQPITQQPVVAAAAGNGTSGDADSMGSGEAAKEAFVAAHFRFIRDKIFRNLNYPALARRMGWSGKVTVTFTVCVDGSVEDVAVTKSSGYPVLDRNAVETVRKSCPLPKPPLKTAFVMPIVYQLE